MGVTANVILSKFCDNRESFSVFYGQSFAKSDSKSVRPDEDSYRGLNNGDKTTASDHSIADTNIIDRIRISNVNELRTQFPDKIDPGKIFDAFSKRINDDSEVSVHSIINLVALFSCVVPEKGAAPNLPIGIPRIETIHND